MPNLVYTRSKALFAGSGDWGSKSQSFGLLLASSKYTPDKRHKFVSDVSGEVTGMGYSRKSLTGRRVEDNDDDERADCFADSVTYTGLATPQSYQWAIVYRVGKTDAESELICALDMGDIPLKEISQHTIRWDGKKDNGRAFSIV
jgi:hypothetical protein